MSRKSDLYDELHRLGEVDLAVRNYLHELRAVENGDTNDDTLAHFWLTRLESLTSDAVYESVGGDRWDKYGKSLEVN